MDCHAAHRPICEERSQSAKRNASTDKPEYTHAPPRAWHRPRARPHGISKPPSAARTTPPVRECRTCSTPPTRQSKLLRTPERPSVRAQTNGDEMNAPECPVEDHRMALKDRRRVARAHRPARPTGGRLGRSGDERLDGAGSGGRGEERFEAAHEREHVRVDRGLKRRQRKHYMWTKEGVVPGTSSGHGGVTSGQRTPMGRRSRT